MNIAEIQIQFPRPGEWGEFSLTSVYRDADGYTRTDRYTAAEIPADQAPALAAVVAALVGLGEDWQASQVWARLGWVMLPPDEDSDEYRHARVVHLTVEAVNAQGGRRMFATQDYPKFVITDEAAVAFFKYFTRP